MNKKLRIAIFSDTFVPDINGVAVSTFNLWTSLRARGHYVVVVTSNPYSRKVTLKDDVLRIPGIEMKKLFGYHFAPPSRRAYKILKKLNIDVVHVQSEAGMGMFGKWFARLRRLPYVYTYHTMYEDYTHYVTKGKMDPFAKSIIRHFSRWQAESASEFISPSDKTKIALREYGVYRYVNVIPTGIDFTKFAATKESLAFAEEYKAKHGLNQTFNLVYVGRVAKEKSIDVLLEGYAKYIENTPNHATKFVIVGGGPAIPELEKHALKLGIKEIVHFVGRVEPDEIGAYYYLGDVFVSASLSETQGLTYMEAMAAERILLCRFDEGLVNVIKDEETGFFFKDEKDFGERFTLVRSLSKAEKQDVINAASAIVDYYSNEKFSERSEEVYYRAIRNSW